MAEITGWHSQDSTAPPLPAICPALRRWSELALCTSVHSLKCRLCRNGLLGEYEVYSRETDRFGVPGQPQLYAFTNGYFYSRNTRHVADILEIAGEIQEKILHDNRLLQFDDNALIGDLILIRGVFYRVDFIREVYPSCRILDLEVEQVETAD